MYGDIYLYKIFTHIYILKIKGKKEEKKKEK